MSPATPIRNRVSCARIFRAVSAGLPLTIRRANMPKWTATTMAKEIGKASPAILAAVRCDLSIGLLAISYPPTTNRTCALSRARTEAGDGKNLSLSALRSFEQEGDTLAQICVTPDKRANRTSKVMVRQVSGDPAYRDLKLCY